ncbi:MAG: hypothetical protein EOM24_30955 [Chloroflexia bacterium]|nr:hypothetical protein [Chloroflexia bacterium]
MPWIERPAASLTYTLEDETGSKSSFSLDVPETTAMDVAMTAAAAIRPLIEACTDCEVTGYSLTYSSRNTTPAAAGAGSRVERKGVFQFHTAAGKVATYQLPGIIDAAVLADGRIDDDHLAIAALTTALVAADALFCDSNGVDLAALSAAYERFNSTTKGQMPTSRRPD